MNTSYTVHETARLLDVTTAAVYSYERKGLLTRDEDPHKLKPTITFPKETVDQLVEKKKNIANFGVSIAQFAKKLGVYDSKVYDAIEKLQLDVPMVYTSVLSQKPRYAITPELEQELTDYIERKKKIRIKKNHFYYPEYDIALYQAFYIGGEQRVRLTLGENKEVGFLLDTDNFVPYPIALQKFDIEPVYGIHREKQSNQLSFTDFIVPAGKKEFYQIIDAVYTICGIENVNASFRKGNAIISIRNGSYPSDYSVTALSALQQYLVAGDVEVSDGAWHFRLNKRFMRLYFDEGDYPLFQAEARKKKVSVKELLEGYLKEKAMELKKNGKAEKEDDHGGRVLSDQMRRL